MSNVKVLDTTIADTGPTQSVKMGFLKKNHPIRFECFIGAGDTVLIEGRTGSSGTFDPLYSFTTSEHKDIYVPRQWRARRTVDGGNDTIINVQNPRNLGLTVHTA